MVVAEGDVLTELLHSFCILLLLCELLRVGENFRLERI